MTPNKYNELYINMNPSITYFLYHAHPASIIEGKYDNFIYANYIQLCKSPNNKYLFDMYPRFGNGATYGDSIIDNLLENYIVTGDFAHFNCEDFKQLVCNQIDRGYYLQTFNNEAIIPETLNYQKKDFFCHQGFYYGYDLHKNVFFMMSYDSQRVYRKIEADIAIVYESIFSQQMSEYLASKDRIRPFNSFMLDFKKFKETLYEQNYSLDSTLQKIEKYLVEYVYCIDSTSKNELKYPNYYNNIWGIDIYQFLIDYCNNEYKTPYGLQCFCGIFEHKVLMKKRFDFLKSTGIEIHGTHYATIQEIINEAMLIKNIHILCNVKQDFRRLKECISHIEKIKTLETDLLISVAQKIKNGL